VRYAEGAIEMTQIRKTREMGKMGQKVPLYLLHLLALPRPLDLDHISCGVGILPAFEFGFCRGLIDLSNNSCGVGILPAFEFGFCRGLLY
jgi:hypothetical protein